MHFGKLASLCLLSAALAASAPGQAATLFSDNFDTDSGSTQLNFAGLLNWTVSNGTIDYIRQGNIYGISCAGGAGGCLDMDGSTGNAGRITSIATFALTGGVNYTLSALLSGNQRGGASDSVTIGIVDLADNVLLSAVVNRDPGDPFGLSALGFTLGGNVTVRLFFEDVNGSDNIGMIIDNVLFADNRNGRIPEPASLALLGLAVAAASLGRRRTPR